MYSVCILCIPLHTFHHVDWRRVTGNRDVARGARAAFRPPGSAGVIPRDNPMIIH